MNGKGIEIIGGTLGIATAVLLILGAAIVTSSQGDGKGSDSMRGTRSEPGTARSAIPPIDRQNPERTETATFALG